MEFRYKKSFKIIYRNCCFHSLVELKYAISIEQSHSFLREHIQIWYDPNTGQPTNYIRESTKKYTPDFLVRDNVTGKAMLIEIKPRAFQYCRQLHLRKLIAENYITVKGHDWIFAVVFDDEIRLTTEQQKLFETLCKTKSQSAYKIKFQENNKRFDRSQPNLFRTVPENTNVHFVKYGDKSSLTKFA